MYCSHLLRHCCSYPALVSITYYIFISHNLHITVYPACNDSTEIIYIIFHFCTIQRIFYHYFVFHATISLLFQIKTFCAHREHFNHYIDFYPLQTNIKYSFVTLIHHTLYCFKQIFNAHLLPITAILYIQIFPLCCPRSSNSLIYHWRNCIPHSNNFDNII